MEVIDYAFNDVATKALPQVPEGIGGTQYLDNIGTMQVGYGTKVLRVDKSGIWLGAERFADAPFSVDMEGNVVASTLNLSDYLSKAGTAQVLSGDIQIGVAGVKIDGANKRILINDGTNDRILIGYQASGF